MCSRCVWTLSMLSWANVNSQCRFPVQCMQLSPAVLTAQLQTRGLDTSSGCWKCWKWFWTDVWGTFSMQHVFATPLQSAGFATCRWAQPPRPSSAESLPAVSAAARRAITRSRGHLAVDGSGPPQEKPSRQLVNVALAVLRPASSLSAVICGSSAAGSA